MLGSLIYACVNSVEPTVLMCQSMPQNWTICRKISFDADSRRPQRDLLVFRVRTVRKIFQIWWQKRWLVDRRSKKCWTTKRAVRVKSSSSRFHSMTLYDHCCFFISLILCCDVDICTVRNKLAKLDYATWLFGDWLCFRHHVGFGR